MEKQMVKKGKIVIAIDPNAKMTEEQKEKILKLFDETVKLVISLKDETTPIIIGVDYYVLSVEEFCKNILRYRNVKTFLIDKNGNWDGIIRNVVPPKEEKITDSTFRLDKSKIVIVDQGLEKGSVYKILEPLEDQKSRMVFCKDTLPESLQGDLHVIRHDSVTRAPLFYRSTPFIIFGENWVYNSIPSEDLVVDS